MGFSLGQVVPWGRTYAEYARMFALAPSDMAGDILGCGDGPASFNAEATAKGHRVTSCDPLYRYAKDDIARRIDETADVVLDELRKNASAYRWNEFATPEDVGRARLSAMARFLQDYDTGKAHGRYVDAALPALPWPDGRFSLALGSHFLFLYSDHLDTDFHVRAMLELCRVAREVRVFPLTKLDGSPSQHAPAVLDALRLRGHEAEVVPVPYDFQIGAEAMLRIHCAA